MPKTKQKHFEYQPVAFSPTSNVQEMSEMLNRKGKEGWELITVTQTGLNVIYYFKRETGPPKIEKPAQSEEKQ